MANHRSSVNSEYFAAIPFDESQRLADEMKAKITAWRNWGTSSGVFGLQQKMYQNYYGYSGNGNSSQTILSGGSSGELSMLKVNDLRKLIQEQLVTITSQRPAGVARAVNSDSQSLKSAKIGTAIAEYYMSEANFEASFVSACEMGLLLGESFVDGLWDKDVGDPIAVDPDTGRPEMSGDWKIRVHCPWNVARDIGSSCKDQKWFIISYKANKFDLAAKYPKFSDKIVMCTNEETSQKIALNKIPDESDEIYVHLLIHDRTASVPDGRYSLLVGDSIVLDTTLPYKDFPVDRMSPSEVIDGITGYTSAFDMLGAEEASDALISIILTNNVTFGGQSIVGPQGAELKVSDIAKGLRYFELPPDMIDKLKPLQMTKTAPETYQFLNMLRSMKAEMTGNVTNVLGQQAVQGASGSAMALIQAQAIQFNSGSQRSYYRLMSAQMTKGIFILAKYADTPRVARIVGKAKSQGLKEFKYTGQDLNSISSIIFEMTNAVSQSMGGKLAMAQDLIKSGLISNPKEYITVATTGSLDSMTMPDELDQLLLIEENEWLSEGREVKAIITEIHADHIKAHRSILSSPKAKEDPQVLMVTLEHIQDHINLWQEASATNPGLLMATGQQPLQMVPPMPPPGAPQGIAQTVGDGQAPAIAKAQETQMPKMPVNPATGERVEMNGAV